LKNGNQNLYRHHPADDGNLAFPLPAHLPKAGQAVANAGSQQQRGTAINRYIGGSGGAGSGPSRAKLGVGGRQSGYAQQQASHQQCPTEEMSIVNHIRKEKSGQKAWFSPNSCSYLGKTDSRT
jgi:hypothetical protein